MYEIPKHAKITITIILSYLVAHFGLIFAFPLASAHYLVTALAVLLMTFLSTALFIAAHDAMHGLSWPGNEDRNRLLGQTACLIYGLFSFDEMKASHDSHHATPGTKNDPDFLNDTYANEGPLRWYFHFFRANFRWTQLAGIFVISMIYKNTLGADLSNMLLFWALPGFLSSFQLFFFGTYLPHRKTDQPFSDNHRARSNDYPAWLSFITCLHFGYHHEHHLFPYLAWWQLPAARRQEVGPR